MVSTIANIMPGKGERLLLTVGGLMGGWISYALGGIDEGVIWLAIFVGIDYVTGIASGAITGRLDSKRGFLGVLKKATMFVIVAVCHGMDVVLETHMIRDGAVVALVANEALSIIENIEKMGFGSIIPRPLRAAVKQIKEKEKQEQGGKDNDE